MKSEFSQDASALSSVLSSVPWPSQYYAIHRTPRTSPKYDALPNRWRFHAPRSERVIAAAPLADLVRFFRTLAVDALTLRKEIAEIGP